MADLGDDFAGIEDLTPDLREVSGRQALLEALAARLIQPRAGLFYDPNYGFDTRSLLSAETIPRGTEQAIANQCLAEERVESATATVTFDAATRTLEIHVAIVDADGPFVLVLDPANASAALFESAL